MFFDFLFRMSDLSIFLILVGFTTSISVMAVFINQRFILNRLHYKDNPTIGSISSLIGLIYGVLAGLMALYLIDNNDHASDAVQREANAAANIYRDSQWLKEPFHHYLDGAVRDYLNEVIKIEWPLMQGGKDIPDNGDVIIASLSNELKTYEPLTHSEIIIVEDLLNEIKSLYDARHDRISMSASELSPELWEVILVGTILIIAINYAFRVSFYLHLFAISAFAIMAASMLFLLVTLDRPFQGEFTVQPDALSSVLAFMSKGAS